MRCFFYVLIFIFFNHRISFAESLDIPSATIPSGYDRISTSDGTTCESTIASDMYIQTGLMGMKINNDYNSMLSTNRNYNRNIKEKDKIGIYAQIIIPIGNKRKRIDCNRLYELEIKNLKAQLLKLKLESMTIDVWNE